MKVEHINSGFEPISIILESQEEVNFIHELTRNISGTGKMRDFFDDIGNSILNYSTLDYGIRTLDGDLRVIKG